MSITPTPNRFYSEEELYKLNLRWEKEWRDSCDQYDSYQLWKAAQDEETRKGNTTWEDEGYSSELPF